MPVSSQGWHFQDAAASGESGVFELSQPDHHSYLYFPLVNERGLISVVTPLLHGDIKTSQNTFLTPPVTVEDLHTSRAGRNFWVRVGGRGVWSAVGQSAPQIARRFGAEDETVKLEAGFLWHTVTRSNLALGLQAQVTSFVPASADAVELMRVTLTNIGPEPVDLTATAAIPLYGRSADNQRDHRHVTSLLHRIHVQSNGILVRPTLSFDERGHLRNTVAYAVLGAEADGAPPAAFFPVVEDFVGEGGTLDWPETVVTARAGVPAGAQIDGYEALGGLQFRACSLQPGQSHTYVLILAILDDPACRTQDLSERYGQASLFEAWLERTKAHWAQKLEGLRATTGDKRYDNWLKWVTIQPTLRRICGNSFLPYHDYGRGGRGWRDLWQDLLALLLMDAGDVRSQLFSNFAGVRVDGSNATIIGEGPGEFKADRNDIPRVWMDHGAWPLLTTRFYLDQTGDLAFLLRDQAYFKDALAHRAQQRDAAWTPEQGTLQLTAAGEPYRGTVFEHLLLQHLIPFFNVGEHNIIRLEGGDWNDGLDMARTRGESGAFSALYAGNLRQLAELARWLQQQGIGKIELAAEALPLLDTLADVVDYASPGAKRHRVAAYLESCRHTLSGYKVGLEPEDLARDLDRKADWLCARLGSGEWIEGPDGCGWFNGYYDEDGQRVEGDFPEGARMILTSQVFPLMAGVATAAQAHAIVRAADRYLFDARVGGYRLNTDFGEVPLNLGRCFGFAFGHKENGAMFSHMAVMYANALYGRGLAAEGFRVLDGLYKHCQNFATSRMYPGLPEYVNPRGRGMYPYLTGSASWYLLTLVTEVFGVRGQRGDLALWPRLMRAQFDERGQARLRTIFAGRPLDVTYHNPAGLECGDYRIAAVRLDGQALAPRWEHNRAVIDRGQLTSLGSEQLHQIDADLAAS